MADCNVIDGPHPSPILASDMMTRRTMVMLSPDVDVWSHDADRQDAPFYALNICNGCEPVRCNVTVDTVPMMPDVRQNLVLVRHKTLKMLHENLTDFSYSLERHNENGQFRFIKFNITT
ncbi:hypothetical protein J6590_070738 [Homalodisca vitripennis]|nr:hypothetical protein J6590_070738 [Homalodisca vitripennis]